MHFSNHRCKAGNGSAQRFQIGSDFFAREQFEQALDRRRDRAHIAEASGSGDARHGVDMTSEIGRYTARREQPTTR